MVIQQHAEYDVLVVGGSGVDTIVRVDSLPVPLADSVPVSPIEEWPGHTGGNVALGTRALGLKVALLDCIGDERGRVGPALERRLELDEHQRAITAELEHVVEQRNADIREPEPRTRVESAQRAGRECGDLAVSVGRPVDPGVVDDGEATIGGDVHVDLDCVAAGIERRLDRRQRVLRVCRGSPAVAAEERSASPGQQGPDHTGTRVMKYRRWPGTTPMSAVMINA